MKRLHPFWEFIILGIAGTLWHFVYEWTGENAFVGIIAPINESIWEHLKLLFFPTVIYSVIEYFIIKERPENYIAASTIGLFAGLLSIIVFYYTYTGILGFNVSVLDILSYFISLAVMLYIKTKIIKSKKFASKTAKYISLYMLIHTAVMFWIFTFFTPSLGVFISPVWCPL